MEPQAVLDEAVLASLRQLTPPGEADILSEVLRLFLDEVPPRIERLRNALAAGDIQEVHRSAHSLKGSAGNIGAGPMFDVCKQLDERGKAGDRAGCAALVGALDVEFGKVESAIRRVLAGGA